MVPSVCQNPGGLCLWAVSGMDRIGPKDWCGQLGLESRPCVSGMTSDIMASPAGSEEGGLLSRTTHSCPGPQAQLPCDGHCLVLAGRPGGDSPAGGVSLRVKSLGPLMSRAAPGQGRGVLPVSA